MQPQTAPPMHDLAKTLRYRREEITTKFTRERVDVDDTVPVALYSRPYERIEIQDSSPYERIEIEMEVEIDGDADASCIAATRDLPADVTSDRFDHAYVPSSSLRLVRLVLAFSILCCTFALGFGLAFLML